VAKALPQLPPKPPPNEREQPTPEPAYPEYTDQQRDPQRQRRAREVADGLTPEERAARTAAFRRGMWGAKLVWLSLLLYALSMIVIGIYFIAGAATAPEPLFLVVAGALGSLNWVAGGIGIVLCLSGPNSPGHRGYGIAAVVAALIHASLLGIVVAVAAPISEAHARTAAGGLTTPWAQLPTQLDRLTMYLTYLVYPDEFDDHRRSRIVLGLVTGAIELVRLVTIILVLSCLARAAGDEELAQRCARSAGRTAFAPGLIALGVFSVFACLIETGGKGTWFGMVLLGLTFLAVDLLVAFLFIPPMVVARDTAEACEFPFQTQKVQIGE
jgi:hypothetical protein